KAADTFTVRWDDTFVDFAVIELVPSKRIVWRVTDCNLPFVKDKKEWKDTQVVFDFSSDHQATTVTMTHAGLTPVVECYNACRKGWDFYILESLQNLLSENRGLPDMQGRREGAEQVTSKSR
ncbi:MAG TPA: SRPBCC domain-containing protein, partial [Edaphobacter sp.]|uniref:SRPBCC domain-containing protein n=1 Tax=Edaphobacter sp. TaxID=1934404 RepID=UPI002B6C26C7